jgi:hypothetical protein
VDTRVDPRQVDLMRRTIGEREQRTTSGSLVPCLSTVRPLSSGGSQRTVAGITKGALSAFGPGRRRLSCRRNQPNGRRTWRLRPKGVRSRTVTPVGRFLAELGGMCAVMCVGGSLVSFVAFHIATWLGHPNLVQQSLYLSVVIVAVCLSRRDMISAGASGRLPGNRAHRRTSSRQRARHPGR